MIDVFPSARLVEEEGPSTAPHLDLPCFPLSRLRARRSPGKRPRARGSTRSALFIGAVMFSLLCFGGRANAQVPRWVLKSAPSVSIGQGNTPDDALFRVTDASVLSDGRIVIVNSGAAELRLYSSTGKYLRSFGREGDGPAEFRSPRTLRTIGADTLIVFDQGLFRLTWLSISGGVLRTRRVGFTASPAAPLPAPANLRPFRSGLRPLENGGMPLARLNKSPLDRASAADGLEVDSLSIDIDDDGALRRVFRGRFGVMFHVSQGGGGLTTPIPFGELALYATGANRVVVGSSHGALFQALGPDGQVIANYSAVGEARRPTAKDKAAFEAQLRNEYSAPMRIGGHQVRSPEPMVDLILSKAPYAERVPLFDRLVLDSAGRLWVREYALEGESAEWQVVDARRGVVGRVAMPSRWSVFEIGPDYVLVKDFDRLGVEVVKKFDIERP